jgi:hypothetical protein
MAHRCRTAPTKTWEILDTRRTLHGASLRQTLAHGRTHSLSRAGLLPWRSFIHTLPPYVKALRRYNTRSLLRRGRAPHEHVPLPTNSNEASRLVIYHQRVLTLCRRSEGSADEVGSCAGPSHQHRRHIENNGGTTMDSPRPQQPTAR